jgi:hypothetical protein
MGKPKIEDTTPSVPPGVAALSRCKRSGVVLQVGEGGVVELLRVYGAKHSIVGGKHG